MRRQPGGYFWNATINDAQQAEKDARKHLESLRRVASSGVATAHLLDIALNLAAIQTALTELRSVNVADRN